MPDFTDRIRRVTADLQAIRLELETAALPGADPGFRQRIAGELLEPATIDPFKAVVDEMRLMLWSYIEAGSKDSPQGLEAKVQSVRMQRVTNMLKTIQPEVGSPSTAALPGAATFFELIHDIAHNTIDRHQGPL